MHLYINQFTRQHMAFKRCSRLSLAHCMRASARATACCAAAAAAAQAAAMSRVTCGRSRMLNTGGTGSAVTAASPAVALIPTLSILRTILSFFFALCYRATELPALLTSSIPYLSHHCPTSVPSCVSSRTTIRVLRVPHTPRALAAHATARVTLN